MNSTMLRAGLFFATTALLACSNPPPPTDASSEAGPTDVLVFPDVATDGSGAYNPDYRRCTMNSECSLAQGEVCDLTFSGGMCRRVVCGTSTECGAIGICTRTKGCVPSCTLQSDTCAPYGGICLAFALPFESNTGCFPSCDPAAMNNDPEGGARACTNMLVCDPYRGQCVSRPSTSGLENGEPCADDGECRSGLCIPEVDTRFGPRSTGFLGGYCVSYAPLPRESVFTAARGMNLPTSTCPPNTVVLPSPESSTGSAARCLKACTNDTQCRAGYRCDRRGSGTDTFANGGCVPIDCAAAGAMCPSGTTCTTADSDAGMLFIGSRCVRGADGGASDASANEAGADSAASDAAMDSASDASAAMDASAG